MEVISNFKISNFNHLILISDLDFTVISPRIRTEVTRLSSFEATQVQSSELLILNSFLLIGNKL